MNIKEWAEKLNGREYGEELTRGEELLAKNDGIVIVFGASDDLMEFRGMIYDEISAWEGETVKITSSGTIYNSEENRSTFEYNSDQIANMKTINIVWCPHDLNTSWLVRSNVNHETFDILEYGELYCRGAVFNIIDFTE